MHGMQIPKNKHRIQLQNSFLKGTVKLKKILSEPKLE